MDLGLNSVEEYWNEVIVPNVKAFHTEHSRPSLFNASQSVWHIHDWVWHDRNPEMDPRYNPAFKAYRDQLLVDCPQLGWLRDVADVAKHRGMGRLPEVKGAEQREVGRFRGLLLLTENTRVFYLVLNDGMQEAADDVVRVAVAFWQEQLKDKKLITP
jgi:hypothetical protein